MIVGPDGLGEIAALLAVYGTVCVVAGGNFAVLLGPPILRRIRALRRRK